MTFSRFFSYALACNGILFCLYTYHYQKYATLKDNVKQLKQECHDLELHAHRLLGELHAMQDRSSLKEYALNELGMQEMHPNQRYALKEMYE